MKGKKYRICVCGGGNMGHAIAAILGAKEDLHVDVLTRNPNQWDESVVAEIEYRSIVVGTPNIITNDPSKVIPYADLVFITVPAFGRAQLLNRIKPYLKANTWVGCFPGSGGFSWIAKSILDEDINIFGLQRVPYISRIIEYGKSVNITGIKKELFVASIPASKIYELSAILEEVFDLPVKPLHNYLEVTLSNSNPILHPSRLYSLFHDYYPGKFWDEKILFYEDWDVFSSEILLKCDEEIQAIRDVLPMDMSGIKSLKEHYESEDEIAITKKLSSITAFKGIPTDMIKTHEGYIPNLNSRYFTEDIPFGLIILKGMAELVRIETPTIDMILEWSQQLINKEYIVDGKLIGKDIKDTGAPQVYGINSIEDLLGFVNN